MSRKRIGNLARVAISVVLLALLFRTVGWAAVAEEIRAAEPMPLLGAVLLYCVGGTVVRALRWRALITSLGQPISVARSIRLFLVGTFFSQVLPTGIGGDVVRGLLLARDGLGRARALGTVVVDRAVGVLLLLAVGLMAVLLVPGHAGPAVTSVLLVTGVGGLGGLLVLFQVKRWRGRVERWPLVGWIARRPGLARFMDSFGDYDATALLLASTWAFVFTLLLIGANALLGRSVGIDQAALVDWAVVVPLAALSVLLPSVGGWGIREWTYVGLLALFEPPVPAETAMAVSLLFGGLNLLLAAVGAVFTVGGSAVGLPTTSAVAEAERLDA